MPAPRRDNPSENADVADAKAALLEFGREADAQVLAEMENVRSRVMGGVKSLTPWAAVGAGLLGLFAIKGIRSRSSRGSSNGSNDGARESVAHRGVNTLRTAIDIARMALPIVLPMFMNAVRRARGAGEG